MAVHSDIAGLVGALPIAAYVCQAPAGTLTFWNQAAVDLWGREPQEGATDESAFGQARFVGADGHEAAYADTPMAAALRTGEPRTSALTILGAGGRSVSVRVHAVPLRASPGVPAGALVLLEPDPDGSAGGDPVWLTEARYRAIVEDQPDFVCRFLPDGTVTFANDAYCRFFGVRRADIIGRRYQPVVHPDDLAGVQAQVAQLSPDHPVVLIENRVYRGDGGVRWTHWTNRALYDANGRLLEFQSAGRDITDRKQAEEATARLAAIVSSADVAIYATTLEGVITSWNRAAERMYGYPASDAIGRPIGILIPGDQPHEDLDLPERVRRGETIEQIETEKVRQDGRRIPVSLTLSPIRDANGQIIGISRIARDITERKRAQRELQERESRFRLLADHAPVLIWLANTENKGIYFNQPWLEFTGVPLEEQLGDGWLTLIHPEDRATAGKYCQQHFDRRLPFTMEFRLRHRSGEYRWVQDTGRPLVLPDGTFNGYIGSCVDIHARKEDEERVQRARATAEEASRLKDEFLAIVSHELRTPLNAILGWTRLLREGALAPDAGARALETIERNAKMQAQLVEDLLDVSRIVSGQLALRMEPVNPALVVRAAVEAVSPAAAAKQIDLTLQLPETDAAVVGDPGRLQQAVWNLLVNAIKFTPNGGSVDVRLQCEDGQAIVSVRDTGAGIAAEALPYIFDRFRQADSRTTRAHGGLGLGLTIVSHIAESHGGTIRAASAGPGRGATFELTLPLDVAATADEAAPPALGVRPDLTGRRVLVVDDEPDARELVRTLLESCGAAVVTASAVSEGIAAAHASLPDLVISDIGMPEQDGFQFIRLLRGLDSGRHVPAIALTAYASPQHRSEALEAGYDAHVAKPVDADALCMLVVNLCRSDTTAA